jgi:hypothetical protein
MGISLVREDAHVNEEGTTSGAHLLTAILHDMAPVQLKACLLQTYPCTACFMCCSPVTNTVKPGYKNTIGTGN